MADPELPPSEASAAEHEQRVGKASANRLRGLLSSAAGEERVLATVGYVASILHHLCASAPWIALQTRLSLLTRLKGRAASQHVKPTPTGTKSKFAALSSLASETRYNLRLFGLIPLWVWGSETLRSPPADPIIRTLTILQVISNVIYQFLENVSYLASKGIISRKFIDKHGGTAIWEMWSTRGWFGHIFFEFFVLWRQHVLRKRRVAAQRAADGTTESKETKAEDAEAMRLEIRSWRKSLVNNTLWAPLCLHWCFEKGIGVPDHLVGIISLGAGIWGLCDSWAATAKA
ncbi:Peroxisomal biogenesis factor 11 [Penicillium maclennaniae]|uniref:Peroxisomal biogenesis factor 11 n=1 Tax=Penicillium maclennaniae TaxID=1343394 RepID=UPI002541A046|nr:Peroxisomal biogenesis factor 11 [Penicillium maclennaniae]KAJ5674553.1 Peroxisomal biogenesis factor 11 [Penicillium maclennaniae]